MRRFFFTIIIVAFFIFAQLQAILAWGNCPFGLTNDPFPGSCPRYLDTNKDSLCDYSQEEPGAKQTFPGNITPEKQGFHFGKIFLATTILYFTSYLLVKIKKISLLTHRKIWNFLLLFSFLPTGLSAILWLAKIDYGLNLLPGLNITFWHIESGIVMVTISLFHLLWHWSYFKNLIKK